MSFDTNGIGARSSISLTAGVTAMSAFNSLPEPVRVFLGVLALAIANFAVEWFRFKHAELKRKRERLEAEAARSVEPESERRDSSPGFARLRALFLVGALFLVACGGRFFVRVFSEPTLGKCAATGYARDFEGDPAFTSYSGAIQCLSASGAESAYDVPLPRYEPDGSLEMDAHEEDTD